MQFKSVKKQISYKIVINRWTFRIVYLSSDNSEAATTAAAAEYKKLDFEAESRAAVEIHSKLSHLIDWQPSKTRDGGGRAIRTDRQRC